MAEPELKLDVACPRCGTSNMPAAIKCRQCFQELPGAFEGPSSILGSPGLSGTSGPGGMPGLFDFPRALVTCPACGKSNAFNMDTCVDCGASIGGSKLPSLENVIAPERLRKAVRSRRRSSAERSSPAWLNLAWLLRLGSVVFLFWGVIDTSFWLDKYTRGMTPEDPLIIRYSLFAIYEIVRDATITGGIWLLTFLKPRR